MIGNDELELIAYDTICKIIKERIDNKTKLTKETTSDDLIMDSLNKIELLMWCEEAFDTDISNEKWEKCNTLGDIHSLILESHPTIDTRPPEREEVKKVENKKRWSWGGWW